MKITVLAIPVFMLSLCSGCGGGGAQEISPQPKTQAIVQAVYPDGRPTAQYRINAIDQGVVLRHGDTADALGARDVFVYQSGSTFYMTYDGATSAGWMSALATSTDLINWTKRGSILSLGVSGENDSAGACYGVTYFDGNIWHMFYLGTPKASPAPNYVPEFPYLTMKATSTAPDGPWTKQPAITPFTTAPGTYYSHTASPGQILKQGDTYLQFFSSTGVLNNVVSRTIGIARTTDLNSTWQPDPAPILPMSEQIENASLYYQAETATWFLFTNHIGIDRNGNEYTDAIWVYWSQDIDRWNPANKAVVLDGSNSIWSKAVIGLPSVIKAGNKLAIFYDGQSSAVALNTDAVHMRRDVGLAYLPLPIKTP